MVAWFRGLELEWFILPSGVTISTYACETCALCEPKAPEVRHSLSSSSVGSASMRDPLSRCVDIHCTRSEPSNWDPSVSAVIILINHVMVRPHHLNFQRSRLP